MRENRRAPSFIEGPWRLSILGLGDELARDPDLVTFVAIVATRHVSAPSRFARLVEFGRLALADSAGDS
jgi:hypothetical protein